MAAVAKVAAGEVVAASEEEAASEVVAMGVVVKAVAGEMVEVEDTWELPRGQPVGMTEVAATVAVAKAVGS